MRLGVLRVLGGLLVLLGVLRTTAVQAYVPDERWSTTASGPTGFEGTPITLTWGFARDGVSIPGEGTSNLIAYLDDIFDVTSGGSNLAQRPWFDLFEESFNRWAELGGIAFIYEPSDDGWPLSSAAGLRGARADIRLGGAHVDGSGGTLAYTALPNDGDIVFDTGEATFFSNTAHNYRQLRNTLMHEIAHGFGLLHLESSTSALLLEPFINAAFDGPQLDDIRGIHALYGDFFEKSNDGQGNETAALATGLGTIFSGGKLMIGNDALGATQAVDASETDFVSIADSFDSDFYSFSVTDRSTLDITLTPLGGIFMQGTEDGSQASFNANVRNNLSISLLDHNGITLLAFANNVGAGETESLSEIRLNSAGVYFVRVAGASDSIQLYQLELSVSSAVHLLAGDYNLDGRVDAADYVLWRNTRNQTGASLPADGNGNGVVDLADYTIWRSNFGSIGPGGAGAAINILPSPEPPGLFWFGFAALVKFLHRRNRRSRPSGCEGRSRCTARKFMVEPVAWP